MYTYTPPPGNERRLLDGGMQVVDDKAALFLVGDDGGTEDLDWTHSTDEKYARSMKDGWTHKPL